MQCCEQRFADQRMTEMNGRARRSVRNGIVQFGSSGELPGEIWLMGTVRANSGGRRADDDSSGLYNYEYVRSVGCGCVEFMLYTMLFLVYILIYEGVVVF